jgi:hypothetical protein
MERSAKRAAKAVHARIERHLKQAPGGIEFATVRKRNPITAEIVGSSEQVEAGEDLHLSAHVRQYQAQHGLKVGDMLIVHELEHSRYVATGVITDTDLSSDTFGGGGGGGGLGFNTYPQAGNWLYAETDDADASGGSPSGLGIELVDYSSGDGGISIAAVGGNDVEVRAFGGGNLRLRTTKTLYVSDEGTPGGGIVIGSTASDVTISAGGELVIHGLPTSNPGGTDEVWLDGGVLTIGPGGGGGGGGSMVFNETPSGAVNGLNATFTTAASFTGIQVFKNGLLQKPGAGFDYTTPTGNSILFAVAPPSGSTILVTYQT